MLISNPVSKLNFSSNDAFRLQISQHTGNDYNCCYQCGKCTAGCPAGGFMDNPPTKIMRLVQAGYLEEAMRSNALWYCVGCQTCTSRCPQNMDIAATMDALRELAIKTGIVSEDRSKKLVTAFHTSFLNNIRKHGRLQELSLVNSYKLRTRTFLQDASSGIKMIREGKINPLTSFSGKEGVNAKDQIEKIFVHAEKGAHTEVPARKPKKITFSPQLPPAIKPGQTIGYYPGCSLNGTAKEYDISVRKMCELLDIHLQEIPDWNCCGATSAHATSHRLALLLPARNQALADAAGMDYVLAPCAACQNRQVTTRRALIESEELRNEVKSTTGIEPTGRAEFIGVTQLLEGYGDNELAKRVKRPLRNLSLACYYGCLLVRPMDAMSFDDPENPVKMEQVVTTLGGNPVDWAFKIECCGAGLTLAQQEMVEDLTHSIARNASINGAKAFVVACPLCHANLDMRQEGMRKRYNDIEAMPVYYISELVAVACGADPAEVAVGKHFVPALDLLNNQ
ncbi:MAG: 4Fe-4S dicluster domain-containing protein [Chlorobium limicola]|uniref:CoB--CoM heterodisulfide reductase n=1 Tax=Chlorobium limicola (strain DSM 245 / NBRC 103803 / 6330) TaxID=290315 RepID=B3ECJ3_CHLL2|nr:CoB--CoM heterodisulfide reductase [Chlorobium limicola DSM 245]NTV07168.1 4Fe-4S dicluster domain-containing protein [Chlorobium limicola]NTV21111.1 4Fe-4S dicluster domain-containing protein [Chlorobium limicola]